MPEYRWKVTLLSEGMLIQNCQQLFWRNPCLLWSLHPTECPNFDTESHGCSYLYILWENRSPPPHPDFFFKRFFFFPSSFVVIPHSGSENGLVCKSKDATKPSCLSRPCTLLFYVVIFTVVAHRRLPRYSEVPGSQSESPNQCISSNSHTLLILPLKFMLLSSGTPCCGPRCLPYSRVTVTQECCARYRVIPSDAPRMHPKATSIALIGAIRAQPHS